MATLSLLSTGVGAAITKHTASASLTFLTGSRTPIKALSFNGGSARSGSLHCSFLAPSSSLSSSFSGMSLGLDLASNTRVSTDRCRRFVVKAGKAALCQTKRSRSRKSLARTHGFRYRMSTTSGKAVLKRRRAKGRKILCTKTNPSSGKRITT